MDGETIQDSDPWINCQWTSRPRVQVGTLMPCNLAVERNINRILQTNNRQDIGCVHLIFPSCSVLKVNVEVEDWAHDISNPKLLSKPLLVPSKSECHWQLLLHRAKSKRDWQCL
jgi:hypothetical protein